MASRRLTDAERQGIFDDEGDSCQVCSSDEDRPAQRRDYGKERRAAAQKRLEEDQAQHRGERPPRTINEISAALTHGPLFEVGTSVDTRAEVEMLLKETDNSSRTTTTYHKLECDRVETRCKVPGCKHKSRWTFSKIDFKWHCKCVEPHTKVCSLAEREPFSHESLTPYEPKDFARITELQEAVNADFYASSKVLSAILASYIHEPLKDRKMSNTKALLRRNLVGSAREAASRLPALIEALKEQGHAAELVLEDATTIQMVLLAQAKNQFEYKRKQEKAKNTDNQADTSQRTAGQEGSQKANRTWAQVEPEKKKKIAELFEGDDPQTLYVLSWSIAFTHSKNMVESLIPVFFTDGTHMRGLIGGVLYSTIASDANRHNVDIAYTWFFGNESSAGWIAHANFVCPLIPAESRVIIDATQAGIKAFKEKGMCMFICSKHMSGNLKKGDIGGYLDAVKAHSEEDLAKAKARISAAQLEKLLNKYGEECLFMLKRENMYGHHTQSPCESHNNAALPARRACTHVGRDPLTCL